MIKLTVREFRQNLSKYAKEAVKGETFLVNGIIWSAWPATIMVSGEQEKNIVAMPRKKPVVEMTYDEAVNKLPLKTVKETECLM